MKNLKGLLLTITSLLIVSTVFAQRGTEDFSSCAAAFLNQKLIVDEYTTSGKCVVDAGTKGELTVQSAELTSAQTAKPGVKIPFKIAIRDGNSKTLLLFSEKTYQSINIQEVLKQCKKGDSIVLITMERAWALPHSEILVNEAQ